MSLQDLLNLATVLPNGGSAISAWRRDVEDGEPQNECFTMEKPYQKMDDLGGTPF